MNLLTDVQEEFGVQLKPKKSTLSTLNLRVIQMNSSNIGNILFIFIAAILDKPFGPK